MGVYVKTMQMPERCLFCPLKDLNKCPITNRTMSDQEIMQGRPEWCPLVEIFVPHGRLIDGDEVMKAYPQKDNGSDVKVQSVRQIITSMNTILGEEDK